MGRRGTLALVLLCLAAFIPGFFALPVIDRDEARFAQASRQMLEAALLPPEQRDPALHSGGLAIPCVKDVPRLNKPPLIYWLQGAAAGALTLGQPARDAIWMYRIPSLLAAIAAVLLTRALATRMLGPPAGFLAAAMLAVAPVIAWESHQARADMVLLACTLAAMLALWEIWSRPQATWRWPILLWLAIGAGILTKGPITPMIVALTALALSLATRRARWLLKLRPALGLLIAAAIVAPWVVAVADHVGFDNYLAIIHDEVLGRSVEPKEGHWGPPGYHLVVLNLIFWPGVMLAGLGVIDALRHALHTPTNTNTPARRGLARLFSLQGRHDDPALFALAWLAPSWIVFELVSTKLPHYTMPLLPAVAILAARAVLRAEERLLPDWGTRLTRVGLGLWIALGVGFALATAALAITVTPDIQGRTAQAAAAIITATAIATTLALLIMARRALREQRVLAAQHAAILAMLPLLMALCQFLLPHAMGLSARVAHALQRHAPAPATPLAMVDYHEDSMVFHTRGRITRLNAPDVHAFLITNPAAIILGPEHRARELGLETLERLPGFNYSRGQHVDLVLARRPRADATQAPSP